MTTAQKRISGELRQIQEDIVTACKILDNEGLVKGFGHMSARAPGREGIILITPRKALRLVKSSRDIAVVNQEGRAVEGKAEPPLETQMHLAVYKKRPEVSSICRVHSPYAYVFGILERPMRAVHGWSALLGETVPVNPNPQLVTTPELGKEVAEALGGGQALILRGNGSITVGRTIQEACVKSLFLEDTCQMLYRALQLGEPVYVTGEAQKKRAVADEQEYVRAWNYYKSKLP
jgi:ribulose-5-phosphate 4-epimerase/fuculose-1-phosphate aldolase